ncbi:MAG: hypothetical protein JWM10_3201 [Myxococcaceae bacterium]|nr:hypothetical protein [Myxococcaceae bacterium]
MIRTGRGGRSWRVPTDPHPSGSSINSISRALGTGQSTPQRIAQLRPRQARPQTHPQQPTQHVVRQHPQPAQRAKRLVRDHLLGVRRPRRRVLRSRPVEPPNCSRSRCTSGRAPPPGSAAPSARSTAGSSGTNQRFVTTYSRRSSCRTSPPRLCRCSWWSTGACSRPPSRDRTRATACGRDGRAERWSQGAREMSRASASSHAMHAFISGSSGRMSFCACNFGWIMLRNSRSTL